MEAQQDQFSDISWQGQSVHLEDIERELNRLWHDTISQAQGRQVPVRTSVLNLVISGDGTTSTEENLNDTVGQLLRQYPLRAIVLRAQADAPEAGLNTSINAYCYTDPKEKTQVCCEQVLVDVLGEPAYHLRNVVGPLLIPDLPVYLWHIGQPDFDSNAFMEIAEVAHKLVIDTASFQITPDKLRAISEFSRVERQKTAVSDLNWIRLYPWFEVVARFFDDSSLVPHLFGTKELLIEYAANDPVQAHNAAQAALLGGWLFARLEQKPEHVSIKAVRHDELRDGSTFSFCLETEHGGESARFCIDRIDDNPMHAKAWGSLQDETIIDEAVSLPERALSEVLASALESPSADLDYIESLDIAAQVLEQEKV